MISPLTVLHTADWHLGRTLYGRKRYDEFTAFLDWLADLIIVNNITTLLVAGDVFDSATPSNHAQELYYDFLCKVAQSCCRHIVIIAGNHDSPSFLNAPRGLLRSLNVHVVGAVTDKLEDEVILLRDQNDHPEAIVCAVPYLRDRDIRIVTAGETVDDKHIKLIEGIRTHYADVCRIAERTHHELGGHIPIIAMGHLFTVGGTTVEGDGVRELYVGSLAHINGDLFPPNIDYLALGHLHIPQQVGPFSHFRYSGSPIPMGFGEARQEKKVVQIEFMGPTPSIQEIAVPCFQSLERIVGDVDTILNKVSELKLLNSTAWLEIEYTGSEIVGDLRGQIEMAMDDASMEIRRIKNKRVGDRILSHINDRETLDDLDVHQVFTRCLDTYDVLAEDRPEMIHTYLEIIEALHENS